MKLTRWEKRWLVAVFEGFAPPDPRGHDDERGFAPKPREVDHVDAFTTLNSRGTLLAQVGLRFAVVLVGTAPVWAQRTLRGIDALAPEERVQLLQEMTRHPSALVRELTWLMKVQASMSLFGHPDIRERSGYDRDRDRGMPVRLRRKVVQSELEEVA